MKLLRIYAKIIDVLCSGFDLLHLLNLLKLLGISEQLRLAGIEYDVCPYLMAARFRDNSHKDTLFDSLGQIYWDKTFVQESPIIIIITDIYICHAIAQINLAHAHLGLSRKSFDCYRWS